MKKCKYCGKELVRKVWQGKTRKLYERNKRFAKRMFCDNICRSKQLSIDSSGDKNHFYGKNKVPWNKGNRQQRIVIRPKNSYARIQYRKSDGTVYFILEHRELMQEHLGRNLSEDEVVHHIDGDVTNNSIDNLMVCTRSEHVKIHAEHRKNSTRLLTAVLSRSHPQRSAPIQGS